MTQLTCETTTLATGSSTTLVDSQSYNLASQIIALATADCTSNFTYDNMSQLLTVSAGAMPAENFSLDASGNRNSAGYTTGSDNQMTAAPNLANTTSHYEYTYDYEGNTTDKYLKNGTANIEHTVYTWDFKNRLTQEQDYTYAGTVSTLVRTIAIGYDAFGHRIHEMVTNNTASSVIFDQRFIYNGSNLATAIDATTLATQQVFLHGLKQNEFYAQDTVGTSSTFTSWVLGDHQGSVRDVVNNSGTVIDHVVYSSFGNIVSQSNSANATLMLYTSQVYDVYTGLFYYNARWYDASNGKFISVDPIGFNSGQRDLYVYCDNNPLVVTDPRGKEGQNITSSALMESIRSNKSVVLFLPLHLVVR